MTTPRLIIGIVAAAAAAALLGGAELPTPGQTAAASAPTTVFFKFEGPSSPEVFAAMKQEMTALFRGSPFRFDWRRIEEADEIGPVENLVVMRFRGDCRMTFPVPPIDEQGLFAWTEVTDGTVLPFSTVDCDKVRNSIATAVWGGARAQAALLMGRALGRITAHEIFHIFTHSGNHTKHGVTRPSLTAAELIAEKTTLKFEDLHRLDPKN